MNILFFIGKYPNYGGTEKVTSVLANSFVKRGYNVYVVSCEQTHPKANELFPQIHLYCLGYPINSSKNKRTLHQILVDNKIDIIINQFCLPYYTNVLLRQAMKGSKIKLISVLHGVPDRSKKVIEVENSIRKSPFFLEKKYLHIKLFVYNKIIQWSIRYVYKRSDAYVVLSNGFIQSFKNYSGLSNVPKLISLGNPITIETSYDENILKFKKKTILYVGRMDNTNKCVYRILDTWHHLHKDFRDWNLKLVGGGPDLNELIQYSKSLELTRVDFTGFVKDAPIKYYKESSILMLTSDLEGFGLVILEGMSFGVVPVVYGNYPTVYDIINHGINGYITSPPYSNEETVACLRHLMSNPNLLEEMSRNTMEKAKDFSIDAIMEQWKMLINKVL